MLGEKKKMCTYTITISRSVECVFMFLDQLSKEAGRLFPVGNYCAVRPFMSEC